MPASDDLTQRPASTTSTGRRPQHYVRLYLLTLASHCNRAPWVRSRSTPPTATSGSSKRLAPLQVPGSDRDTPDRVPLPNISRDTLHALGADVAKTSQDVPRRTVASGGVRGRGNIGEPDVVVAVKQASMGTDDREIALVQAAALADGASDLRTALHSVEPAGFRGTSQGRFGTSSKTSWDELGHFGTTLT